MRERLWIISLWKALVRCKTRNILVYLLNSSEQEKNLLKFSVKKFGKNCKLFFLRCSEFERWEPSENDTRFSTLFYMFTEGSKVNRSNLRKNFTKINDAKWNQRALKRASIDAPRAQGARARLKSSKIPRNKDQKSSRRILRRRTELPLSNANLKLMRSENFPFLEPIFPRMMPYSEVSSENI